MEGCRGDQQIHIGNELPGAAKPRSGPRGDFHDRIGERNGDEPVQKDAEPGQAGVWVGEAKGTLEELTKEMTLTAKPSSLKRSSRRTLGSVPMKASITQSVSTRYLKLTADRAAGFLPHDRGRSAP
jgi:hypothetical protein